MAGIYIGVEKELKREERKSKITAHSDVRGTNFHPKLQRSN